MKIRIVVDANIVISAFLGGKPRFLLFDPRFEFITTEFTLEEVKKYIPFISKKSSVPEQEIKKGIPLLPLKIIPQNYYKNYLERAKSLIGEIDKDDADILALYLKENSFLWSEDRDFEEVKPKINLLKTNDLI